MEKDLQEAEFSEDTEVVTKYYIDAAELKKYEKDLDKMFLVSTKSQHSYTEIEYTKYDEIFLLFGKTIILSAFKESKPLMKSSVDGFIL